MHCVLHAMQADINNMNRKLNCMNERNIPCKFLINVHGWSSGKFVIINNTVIIRIDKNLITYFLYLHSFGIRAEHVSLLTSPFMFTFFVGPTQHACTVFKSTGLTSEN